MRTVLRWKAAQPGFAAEFALAQEEGFEVLAAECLAIADDIGRDTKLTKAGAKAVNSEWVTRCKLQIDTRFKLLALWCPKKYGGKAEPEVSDGKDDVLAAVFRRIRSGTRHEA